MTALIVTCHNSNPGSRTELRDRKGREVDIPAVLRQTQEANPFISYKILCTTPTIDIDHFKSHFDTVLVTENAPLEDRFKTGKLKERGLVGPQPFIGEKCLMELGMTMVFGLGFSSAIKIAFDTPAQSFKDYASAVDSGELDLVTKTWSTVHQYSTCTLMFGSKLFGMWKRMSPDFWDKKWPTDYLRGGLLLESIFYTACQQAGMRVRVMPK